MTQLERHPEPSPEFMAQTEIYILALKFLNGETQARTLGITDVHYRDRMALAHLNDELYSQIAASGHPEAPDALERLDKLFWRLDGYIAHRQERLPLRSQKNES